MDMDMDMDMDMELNKIDLLKLIFNYAMSSIFNSEIKQVEEINDEMPTNFQIEIIDRLDKYKNRDLDKAIKAQCSN